MSIENIVEVLKKELKETIKKVCSSTKEIELIDYKLTVNVSINVEDKVEIIKEQN